ncbi:MAG: gamma-glutamyltransferase [Syntrophaceae bacterium]
MFRKNRPPVTLIAFIISALALVPCGAAQADLKPLISPVSGSRAMVVTGQDLATRAGLYVLRRGGNAVDAAVTAAFVMAVTLPRAGNIGGGGFMLIYSAKKKEITSLDFWQKAPAGASREMYIGPDGKSDQRLSRFSYLAVAVPGTVAGLAAALKRYGTISFARALIPAIRLAEDGYMLNEMQAADMKSYEQILKAYPSTVKIFFKPGGVPYEAGDMFIQKDLARTLRELARRGPDAFYKGSIAEKIADQVKANGGILTKEDLAAYAPFFRKPLQGSYRGYDIFTMQPPSFGGTSVIEILNILEGYDLRACGHNSAAAIHLLSEAMKRALADAARYAGDPGMVKVPAAGLTSKAYAQDLRKSINPGRATPSVQIRPGNAPGYEKESTTHFSVVDREGNAVSCTFTLNGNFGSGIVVDGAGFLLNNEMDNFNIHPGAADPGGPIEGEANAIAPNKRMTTGMAPTIVMKNGRPFIVTGSPGSSRIISTIVQVIVNVTDFDMNIQEAVNAPKVHNEWLPDELRIEKGISPDTVRILGQMGHKVVMGDPMGAATSILVDQKKGTRFGAADPRREGTARGY